MLAHTFRALRYGNYRLFYAGQGISLIGTWLQQTAMGWLVYKLTGSAFLLGVVGFSGQLPSFLMAPFAGVVSDRLNKHRILLATQTLSMLQAGLLAVLVLTGAVQAWHLIVLSVFLGLVNGFDVPARQSFVIEMVGDRKDLPNAIALNSAMFNAARLVGPAIAGLLIAAIGEGMCFLLNAVSFGAVIAALLLMKLKHAPPRGAGEGVFHEIREGFNYVRSTRSIRSVLILLAFVSLVGSSYAVLMPMFAKDILLGGPKTLGYLLSATGAGALLGAFFLASRKTTRSLPLFIAAAVTAGALSLVGLSFVPNLGFTIPILIVTGFCLMVHMASTNTLIQTVTHDRMRGRVMSFYMMSFMGMATFGSLLMGGLASALGARWAILLGGVAMLISAILFWTGLPGIRKAAESALR